MNKLLEILPDDINNIDLEKVVRVILNGGIVIYPTDTTYAVGANALDENAIRNVFKLKNRPLNKPIHVVVDSLEMANQYVKLNENSKKLITEFLPGELTIILPKKKKIPKILVGGLNTLGIRITNNEICQEIVRRMQLPITTTSANLSGEEPIYCVNDLFERFSNEQLDLIDIILSQGPLEKKKPSTIIDMTNSNPVILRTGNLSSEKILNFIR